MPARWRALGQMSAGMVHELNQPLTALRTLSDSAGILLEHERIDEVRGNLQRITGMVDRLARLTSRLKTFAHKSDAAAAAGAAARSIADAQALLGAELKAHDIRVEVDVRPRRPGRDGRRGGHRQRARQPDAQRDRRHARMRRAACCALTARAEGERVDPRRVDRHRPGHPRRHPAAPVRAVRHQQAGRRRARPRARDLGAARCAPSAARLRGAQPRRGRRVLRRRPADRPLKSSPPNMTEALSDSSAADRGRRRRAREHRAGAVAGRLQGRVVRERRTRPAADHLRRCRRSSSATSACPA